MDWGSLANYGSQSFDWLDRNQGWLKPVVATGMNTLSDRSQNRATNQYLNVLRDAQQQDFANQKANYDAYTQWLSQSQAAANANRSASNARAAANERARLAGVRQAIDQTKKTYANMDEYTAPFADMGLRVRPQIEAAYTNALKNLGGLTNQVMAPDVMAKSWNQSKPIWEMSAPLPQWVGK